MPKGLVGDLHAAWSSFLLFLGPANLTARPDHLVQCIRHSLSACCLPGTGSKKGVPQYRPVGAVVKLVPRVLGTHWV